MIAVLADGGAMSVAEVRSALDAELAHTTVMTTLVRLTEKKLLTRSRAGRTFAYELAAPAAELPARRAALRMRRELDTGDREDVLASFVATLDATDEALLRDLLADSDSGD